MEDRPKKTADRTSKRTQRREVVYGCRIEGNELIPTVVTGDLFEMWGYRPEEVVGDHKWWVEHLHPEDRVEVLEGLKDVFTKGVHTHEYRFRHKDGSYRWIYDRLRLVRDEAGTPIEIVGSWLDITEFKPS